MKTCFAIMPFKGFDDIDAIIGQAAADCELHYLRGDRRVQPGMVLPRILRDIEDASVVVADITGHNPNVFYELGIAHHLKGPDRVVVITQDAQKSPYDVHHFNQLVYEHSPAGREELRRKLPGALRAAAHGDEFEAWKVIRGRLPRTLQIVRDLRLLLDDAGPRGLHGVTIRLVAGLSSIAISDHEPTVPGDDSEYYESLLAERNALRDVLLAGARLKAVLNPPRRFAKAMLPERLRVRYQRLIGLLEGRSDLVDRQAAEADLRALRECEFTLSPVPMPNVFIIGESVAYEGMKRAGTGGFEMTHCETRAEGLFELIKQFDQYFDDSRRDLARAYPPDGRLLEQLRRFFDEATAVSMDE
jgi:hypothetical protein